VSSSKGLASAGADALLVDDDHSMLGTITTDL